MGHTSAKKCIHYLIWNSNLTGNHIWIVLNLATRILQKSLMVMTSAWITLERTKKELQESSSGFDRSAVLAGGWVGSAKGEGREKTEVYVSSFSWFFTWPWTSLRPPSPFSPLFAFHKNETIHFFITGCSHVILFMVLVLNFWNVWVDLGLFFTFSVLTAPSLIKLISAGVWPGLIFFLPCGPALSQ